MTSPHFSPAAFAQAAQTLRPENIDSLAQFYAEDCQFTDPFQSVRGRQAVAHVYSAMFKNLSAPRFLDVRVREMGGPDTRGGQDWAVEWVFAFAFKPGARQHKIPGFSLITLNEDGLIAQHVDYWDASLLMQELAVVGPLLRWIRKKIAQAA